VLADLSNNLQHTLLHVLRQCIARLQLHMLQALPFLGVLQQRQALPAQQWEAVEVCEVCC
jgi:hypothetical protein